MDYYIIIIVFAHVQFDNFSFCVLRGFFCFDTYMKDPSSDAEGTIEATEVRNSKVEDGIFCWRTRSVGGHKLLYVARKGAFIITLPGNGENFP